MANPKADIRAIFCEALDQKAPGELATYLDAACHGDAEVRARVEALLEAHGDAGEFLGGPTERLTVDLTPVTERPGTVIGPYKLLQQIGEGGMGTVYMAEQTQPVQRKVALKVIKPGMDSRQVIARFEAERQALAMMDHVNIARVLDAGATGSGRPYFVMELVHGVPITKYCDDNLLTPRQRLELFVPVCLAIQHAHQKGIIHRDVKPSNVMITLYDGKPVPKVIDFGVAKATEQRLTERTLFTQYGTMVGTLEYTSPEQAEMSGLGVDTRSDIYSLGVLLYELLTGSTPLTHKRMKEAAYVEILRMIKEVEPPKPSTRLSDSGEALASISANRHTEPAKLTKLLRGELDWIVMKTLEKDRNHRYETANGFAMDVQRYLADEPVLACPPSALYRFRKFTRRNKRALATAALLSVMFVAAVCVAAGSIGWAARDRAARQARLAGQVELILDEADRWQLEQKWPEALAAAQRAETLSAGNERDAELEQRTQRLLTNLKMVQRLEEIRLQGSELKDGVFDYEADDRAYAAVFKEYGTDFESLSVEAAAERIRSRPEVAVALAAALDDWASCRSYKKDREGTRALMGIAHAADPDPWRQRVRTALIKGDWKALEQIAASEEVLRLPPATLIMLGSSLHTGAQSAQGLEVLRKAQREYPGDFWINFRLAGSFEQTKPPRLDEAISFYRAALAVRPRFSAVLNNLGNALANKGELDEAVACCRKAIQLQPDLAVAHSSLGTVLRKKGQLDEAIACHRKAIELQPDYVPAHNNLGLALKDKGAVEEATACFRKAIELRPDLAMAHSNLAHAFADEGKLEEAIACYRKAIELQPDHAIAHNNLGSAFNRKGEPQEAIACYRKAIELQPDFALAHYNLGHALEKGERDASIACYRKAIELQPDYIEAHMNLGILLAGKGERDAAIACFGKAIELQPDNAMGYYNLGKALKEKGQADEAITCYHKAIELQPDHGQSHFNLGIALRDKGQSDAAIDCYRKAVKLMPDFAPAHYTLGTALDNLGRRDEAITWYRKAIKLQPDHVPTHYNLGNALKEQGQRDEAIECYRNAIELKPDHALAHYGLGNALKEKNHLDEAVACYRKAIDLKPDYAPAHNNLGNALRSQGQRDEAIACFRRAIQLQPDLTPAHYNLGSALTDKGELAEAVACYREAVRLKPEFAQARNNLPRSLNALAWRLIASPDPNASDANQATALATEAIELAPMEGSSWTTLGLAHYRARHWNDAMASLEKSRVLFAGKEDGLSAFVLAMVNWQLDKKDEARKWYDQAVEWMEKKKQQDDEHKRFQQEAAELLGLNEKQD